MLTDVFQIGSIGQYVDDFITLPPTGRYTDTNAGAPTALSLATTMGGWLNVSTLANVNDYRSISLGPIFQLLAGGQPVKAMARLLITEAAANSSSWWFGLTDTLAAGFLQTSGAPPSSYNGAVIWKPKNSTTILFESATGTTKKRLTNIGAFASGVPILVGLAFNPSDPSPGSQGGPYGAVLPTIGDQAAVGNILWNPQPIALTGLPSLSLGCGIVASTAAVETLKLDFLGAEWYRA